MLPNVKVTVNEEVLTTRNSLNSFLPLVILKTPTGPIGTDVLIKSAKEFVRTFGTPDENTPEAFGLYDYIKLYGNAYVVRVAGSTAANAEGTITFGTGGSAVDLISAESKYKTDELNGDELILKRDTTNNKLYLSFIKGESEITSIKENFTATTKANELEVILNKLVDSFNNAQNYLVLENEFTDKTAEDAVPALTAETKTTITGGISGNTGITDSDVTAIIEKYRKSDIGVDGILAPGFESATVINKLASVAADSSFIAIASVSGNTSTAIISALNGIVENSSLALYADKVYLNEDTSIQVPACIAVLPAYITRNLSSKWLAPAGVTRGTLSHVNSLVNPLSDADLESLYTNTIPVNGIRRISGRGYIVWGQKTALQDSSEYQDRINVVRLIKYLTKEVYKISYDYLFEPITNYTYNSWKLEVKALLDNIKDGNGLSDYKVIMDDTLNTEETKKKNMLVGIVRFKPLEAAEFIEINFVVTDDVEGGNE